MLSSPACGKAGTEPELSIARVAGRNLTRRRSRVAAAAPVALRGSTSVRGGASATGAEGHVTELRASGGTRGAPSGVGVWGQPGQQAGTRVGEGQMDHHGAAGRFISSGGEARWERDTTSSTPPPHHYLSQPAADGHKHGGMAVPTATATDSSGGVLLSRRRPHRRGLRGFGEVVPASTAGNGAPERSGRLPRRRHRPASHAAPRVPSPPFPPGGVAPRPTRRRWERSCPPLASAAATGDGGAGFPSLAEGGEGGCGAQSQRGRRFSDEFGGARGGVAAAPTPGAARAHEPRRWVRARRHDRYCVRPSALSVVRTRRRLLPRGRYHQTLGAARVRAGGAGRGRWDVGLPPVRHNAAGTALSTESRSILKVSIPQEYYGLE